VTFKESTDMM